MNGNEPQILVAGEALIDFVPQSDVALPAFMPIPGGSPLNVAIGLARLDIPTRFLCRLSTDLFGNQLREHLEANGIDMGYVRQIAGPSTLAFVSQRSDRDEPEYAFFSQGAADQSLNEADLPETLPTSIAAIHVGSYSLAVEPIASTLESLVDRERHARWISLDPNVRPSLVGDRQAYLARLERWFQRADVIKLSVADAQWLWPNIQPEELAQQWLSQGAQLIVMTQGSEAVLAWTHDHVVSVSPPSVQLVDSVGAGDSFTSALLAWLMSRQHIQANGGVGRDKTLLALSNDELTQCLGFASSAAAVTCSRRGANPPTGADLAAMQG